jgi:DNA mismatch repair protein MutS2
VHDESGTGATLFVEPPVAVEMMNRLRELEATEQREVTRILRELSARLRPLQPELLATLDAMVALDSVYARARYALKSDGHVPRLLPAGTEEYEVVNGYHPVLQARSAAVVPFDLRMDAGERTLLISGPNTGGKTVLLKAIGLISLLTQSGIIPPVGPRSKLPVFRQVFADIGDEQSIEASLSHLLRAPQEPARGAGRRGLGVAGADGRDRQRHGPGGGGRAGPRHPHRAHAPRRLHRRDHAPGAAQAAGHGGARGGERVAPVRRRAAAAHLSAW